MGFSPHAGKPSVTLYGKKRRARFERRLVQLSVLLVLPGLLISAILVWRRPWAVELKLALLGAEAFLCLLIAVALYDHIVRPLQTLANVVGALREEDYSFRARHAVPNDAMGELSLEINLLADLLAQQRTGAVEATALLQRVVEEVDLPILAFDPGSRLRLMNSAGERLLAQSSAELLGRSALELGLQAALSAESESLVSFPFASGVRWLVRRSSFRQRGVPHRLVVLFDVSRALRAEERKSWQRLIRVIGHELNNSLTPIKSIAGSLNARLSELGLTREQRQDFERGLAIIETRAAALNRFLQSYRQLAQMPPPVLRECSIPALVKRASAMETRIPIAVVPGPDVTILADADQLEQMLINLLRNATEAALEQSASARLADGANAGPAEQPPPHVFATWRSTEKEVILIIEDNGPGLMNPSNAFIPFYTTKSGGSGIGLVFSRQISEAHGGRIELSNHKDRPGCSVTITLPRLGESPKVDTRDTPAFLSKAAGVKDD
jgi:two-component system, NtrC family, nitrogen regulation sensor histidine kinase NtrY